MRDVALPVPTTAGRPYSRATIAAWLIEPPMSDTAPAIFWKMGAQVGFVTWHTRMSPGCRREISSTDFTTRAGPSTTPLLAAKPRISLASPSSALSQASRLSRVMPQSITMAGSSMTSGTGPSAGAVSCFAHSLIAARRWATISGQRAGPRGAEPFDHAVIWSMMASSSSKCVSWNTSSGSAKKPLRASSAPNSRILLKNRFVYQCSQ
jgi:hypothetical protein